MNSKRLMDGASLIEVMVSLFVFAIGILGVLSMQAQSVRFNNNAYLYSKANILANELVEEMRAAPASASAYVESLGSCEPGGDSDCCVGQEAAGWAADWRQRVEDQLPGANGYIYQNADDLVAVFVCFYSGANEVTSEAVTGSVHLITGV